MKLSHLLRDWRKFNKLSLRDVAREIGITHSALLRFERGRQTRLESTVKIILWSLSR